MGCVNAKKQINGVQRIQKTQDTKRTKSNKNNGTYTSIQQNLMKHKEQNDQIKQNQSSDKINTRNSISNTKQASIIQKYRMTVQQNRCQMPKVNSYKYSPLLVHNPDHSNTNQNDVHKKDQKAKNKYQKP